MYIDFLHIVGWSVLIIGAIIFGLGVVFVISLLFYCWQFCKQYEVNEDAQDLKKEIRSKQKLDRNDVKYIIDEQKTSYEFFGKIWDFMLIAIWTVLFFLWLVCIGGISLICRLAEIFDFYILKKFLKLATI